MANWKHEKINADKKLQPLFSLNEIMQIGSVEAKVIWAPKNNGICINESAMATASRIPVCAIDFVSFVLPIK